MKLPRIAVCQKGIVARDGFRKPAVFKRFVGLVNTLRLEGIHLPAVFRGKLRLLRASQARDQSQPR